MKKKSFYLSLMLALGVAFFGTSCSSKLKPLNQNNFNVTPSPMETVGNQVPVTINGTFPEKWFHKNGIVTITPILKYGDQELAGTPYSFQGENISGNRTTISNSRGGNFTMSSSFPYQPEMISSELFLRFNGRIKNKQSLLPDLKVADGVIATSALADVRSTTPSVAPDGFQRIIKEAQEASIMFVIQQANLRQSELGKRDLADWKQRVEEAFNDPRQNINLEVSAYASPDGGLTLNEKLAAQREKNTSGYLEEELKKRNIDTDVYARYTAEDWEGFRQLVSASDLQDKELILRVLEMYPDSETREREIKNISYVFEDLATTILPQLRRSRIVANIEIVGKSDEEIMTAWNNTPKELSVEELLYASSLTDDEKVKERIYQYVTANFSNDYRGWNNIGTMFYKQGDYAKAAQAFNRAAQVNPSAAEVNMNKALLALMENKHDEANELLGRSAGASGLDEAMGVYSMLQGNYNQAADAYGNTVSNNAGLAHLLVRDYNKAKQTLEAVEQPDATTAYLLAIIASRTNNFNEVVSNLRSAIGRDRTIAKKALKDLEFAKYLTNQEFLSLLN
ncbi:MAG: tetratricopeptide repeat protein [Proteiniphilum sp.]|nr:tetratricopeptide repeat protein [Proteiniphilum sp.]MDD3333396.1 tetratricopeptide repeat protein [Proteiniphilum sp.]MDD4486495.1 tetratricopeptide repeat protein [Proteiniphilum sp.]MDY0183384.1 tetratricopeptide repeat protein [Proteiniphilum sp.]